MIETLVYKPTAYRKKKLFPSSSSTSLVTRRFLTAVVSDTNLTLRKSASFASLTPTTTIEDTSSSFLFPIEDDSNDEIDRLVSQHYILRTAFNSDYSIPSSLFKKNNTIVLDVGCGPGTWTMEMASQFPKATFIGVDFRDMSPHDIKPKNCHFQQHLDIVKLPFGDNSVDYIFQRDMNWFLNAESWIPLIKEYFRILKPGGWIELVEPDLESQSSLENESYLNNKLLNLITHKGKDAFVARKLSSIMAASGFRRIESRFQSIPLGWGKNDAFSKASASQQLWLLKSLQPLLTQSAHIPPEKYNQYLDNLLIEWCEARTYINWHRSIAQKPF